MNTTSFSTRYITTTSTSESSNGSRPHQEHSRGDATKEARAQSDRAIVLGGGGSAGNAWLIGAIAGLFDGGFDVTGADLIVGTSAGSTASAQISGATRVSNLYASILEATPQTPGAAATSPRGGGTAGPAVNYFEMTNDIIARAENALDMRRTIGATALSMDAMNDDSSQTRWRATVASRLPSQHWPARPVLITAVDAETGEPVVFDRFSGVDLADAVSASCAVGFGIPPYGIDGHRYIDGGYRRNENADLAAGCGRVLVFSPLGGRTRHPLAWGLQLSAQVDELRQGGSSVETIVPDSNSLRAFGANLMDLSTRPPAARAGYEQGRALAEQLSGFWG